MGDREMREAVRKWADEHLDKVGYSLSLENAFIAGANWQAAQQPSQQISEFSEEIEAMKQLHAETPHIMDWCMKDGFTVPVLNLFMAVLRIAQGATHDN